MVGYNSHVAIGADEAAAEVARRHLAWDEERAREEVERYRRAIGRYRPRDLRAAPARRPRRRGLHPAPVGPRRILTRCTPARETTVRALFDAFARRDVERALTLVDPGFEFWPQGTAERAGREEPYRGADGLRRYFADVAEVWDELWVDPQRPARRRDGRRRLRQRARARGRDRDAPAGHLGVQAARRPRGLRAGRGHGRRGAGDRRADAPDAVSRAASVPAETWARSHCCSGPNHVRA